MVSIEDALVSGGLVLLGAAVAYFFGQRGKAQQTRQDIAFRPSEDRYIALKAAYDAMDDCVFMLLNRTASVPQSMEQFDDDVAKPISKLATVMRKNALWLSTVFPKLNQVYTTAVEALLAIKLMMPSSVTGIAEQSRPPPGVVEVKLADLIRQHAEAVKAIGDAMGIQVLEKGLENIYRQLKDKPIGN